MRMTFAFHTTPVKWNRFQYATTLVPMTRKRASNPTTRATTRSTSSSSVHSPQQARSRETMKAIVAAFLELARHRSYDEISVAEIAEAANISVGGFYARFESKDALIVPISRELTSIFRVQLGGALDRAEQRHATIAGVVHAYVHTMVNGFRERRPLLIQLSRAASGPVAAEVGDIFLEFNRFAHGRFRAMCLARRNEIGHRPVAAGIEFAIFFMSAAARDAVIGVNWRSYEIEPTDDQLIAQLTRTVLRYLDVKKGR